MAAQHQSRDCPLCLCELLLARDEASDVVLALALVDKSLHVMQAVERGSADPRLVLVKLGRVRRDPPWGSSHVATSHPVGFAPGQSAYHPATAAHSSKAARRCQGSPSLFSQTGLVLRALSKTERSRRTR